MSFIKKRWVSILFIALGVVAIIVLLAVFDRNMEKNEENEVQSYLEEIRDNAIFILNSEIGHFSESLNAEARIFGFLGELSEQEIIAEIQTFAKNPSMIRIMIMTLDGTVYSSLDGSIRHYNPNDFKESLSNEKGGVSQPRYSETMKKMIVAVSAPIYLNGQHAGILIGEYDIAYFESLFSKNFLDGDCAINLATADGQIISRSGAFAAPTHFKNNIFDFYFRHDVDFIEGTPEKMRSDLNMGRAGYKSYENEGIVRYVSYAPVGINDWYIAAVSTQRTLTERASAIKLYAFQLTTGIVAVMLIMAVAVFVTRAKEERAMQTVLKKAASIDALTKLFNKSATAQEIDAYLQGDGFGGCHAMLMLDIDGFKAVNDRLGHIKGDEILEQFGATLQSVFRLDDIVGRVGGDEFIAFIKNCEDEQLIIAKAKNICKTLRKTHYLDESDSQSIRADTSVSIGIALYPQDGRNFDTLYRSADTALYESKKNGKDQYCFYQSEGA